MLAGLRPLNTLAAFNTFLRVPPEDGSWNPFLEIMSSTSLAPEETIPVFLSVVKTSSTALVSRYMTL